MSESLSRLLDSALLWRASESASYRCPAQDTGNAELNSLLPGGGWPMGAVTEILCDTPGIGEIRLLAPLLNVLSQQDKWILWVCPPCLPYPQGLENQGIDHSKILLVRNIRAQSSLWVIEQGLRSGQCSAVLAWPEKINSAQIRRLQLACANTSNHCFIFRLKKFAAEQSPAHLRLSLSADNNEPRKIQMDILKRRGRWPLARTISLSIPALRPEALFVKPL
jgi:cell division inhibitor SulA